jgi:hypothetical protein
MSQSGVEVPVRLKVMADDSSLRQSVLNSKVFLETNLSQSAAKANMEGSHMSYAAGVKSRLFSPVSQMMNAALSQTDQSAAGTIDFTTRQNLMFGNMGMAISRFYRPGEGLDPLKTTLAYAVMPKNFMPGESNAAYQMRQNVSTMLASTPNTLMFGGKSAGELMRYGMQQNLDYQYQYNYFNEMTSSLLRNGAMNQLGNRTRMTQMLAGVKDMMPVAQAVGLDPTQAAQFANVALGAGDSPSSLRASMQAYATARSAGANGGLIAEAIQNQQQRSMMLQRAGANTMQLSSSDISRVAGLTAAATSAVSTMTNPSTGENFRYNETVGLTAQQSALRYMVGNPSMGNVQATRLSLRTTYGGSLTEEQIDRAVQMGETSLIMADRKMRTSVIRNEEWQQTNEAFSLGGFAASVKRERENYLSGGRFEARAMTRSVVQGMRDYTVKVAADSSEVRQNLRDSDMYSRFGPLNPATSLGGIGSSSEGDYSGPAISMSKRFIGGLSRVVAQATIDPDTGLPEGAGLREGVAGVMSIPGPVAVMDRTGISANVPAALGAATYTGLTIARHPIRVAKGIYGLFSGTLGGRKAGDRLKALTAQDKITERQSYAEANSILSGNLKDFKREDMDANRIALVGGLISGERRLGHGVSQEQFDLALSTAQREDSRSVAIYKSLRGASAEDRRKFESAANSLYSIAGRKASEAHETDALKNALFNYEYGGAVTTAREKLTAKYGPDFDAKAPFEELEKLADIARKDSNSGDAFRANLERERTDLASQDNVGDYINQRGKPGVETGLKGAVKGLKMAATGLEEFLNGPGGAAAKDSP